MVLKRCYISWRANNIFKDMCDVAFTDNSISYIIREVQPKNSESNIL